MREGLEPLGLDRRQHHALHPEVISAGGAGLSRAAIDEHPVTARREPLADLLDASLEAAVGGGHAASAQHRQAHLPRIEGAIAGSNADQAVSSPIVAAAEACRSSRVTSSTDSAPASSVAEVEATAR